MFFSAVTCEEPVEIGNGSWTVILDEDPVVTYSYKDSLKYTCHYGYYFEEFSSSEVVVSCNASGQWWPNLLFCTSELFFHYYPKYNIMKSDSNNNYENILMFIYDIEVHGIILESVALLGVRRLHSEYA